MKNRSKGKALLSVDFPLWTCEFIIFWKFQGKDRGGNYRVE